jgi:hypothetical protein
MAQLSKASHRADTSPDKEDLLMIQFTDMIIQPALAIAEASNGK